jgi:hypothetical protein
MDSLNESTNKLVEQVTTKDKLIKQMSLKEEATQHQTEKRIDTIRLEFEREMESLVKQNEQLANKLRNLEGQVKSLVTENKSLEEKVKSQEAWDTIKQELAKANDKLVKSEADNTSNKLANSGLQKQNEKLLESIAFEKQRYDGVRVEVMIGIILA